MIVDLLNICLLIHRHCWYHFHLIELSSIFKDKINCRCFWVDFKWPCIDDFHLIGDLLGEDLRVVGLDPAGEEEVFLDGFDDHICCPFALVLVVGGELVGCFFVLHICNKIYRALSISVSKCMCGWLNGFTYFFSAKVAVWIFSDCFW